MVTTLASLAATAGAHGHSKISPSVLVVMRRVPRHLLVPEAVRGHAYTEQALPIGYDATISAPYIVALMTDLLGVRSGE